MAPLAPRGTKPSFGKRRNFSGLGVGTAPRVCGSPPRRQSQRAPAPPALGTWGLVGAETGLIWARPCDPLAFLPLARWGGQRGCGEGKKGAGTARLLAVLGG